MRTKDRWFTTLRRLASRLIDNSRAARLGPAPERPTTAAAGRRPLYDVNVAQLYNAAAAAAAAAAAGDLPPAGQMLD